MLGENVTPIVIEEPPSHTKRETDDMETKEIKNKVKKEKVPERPTRAIPILIVKFMIIPNPKLEMMSSPSTIKLTDTTFEIQIPQPTSRVNKLLREIIQQNLRKTPLPMTIANGVKTLLLKQARAKIFFRLREIFIHCKQKKGCAVVFYVLKTIEELYR
ncbi:hypothetical protein Tco_0466078 [Tanacetum coccineum]